MSKRNLFKGALSMPAKIKKAWLKALRSGEYDQMTGRLTDGEGRFCCLGVLQHVVSDGQCEYSPGGKYMNEHWSAMPSEEWLKENGIRTEFHYAGSPILQLADMNDEDGKSFKQIANWIERNVIGRRK